MRWGETASQVSQMSQNSVWTGILSYSNSFESARVESLQEYMKQKEAVLAGELHQMKTLLEKELNRVEVMKE